MTSTIEEIVQISEELSEDEVAEVREFALGILRRRKNLLAAGEDGDSALEEKPRKEPTGMGKLAHLGVSSYEFDRRKQEEIAREEEQSERRWSGQG